MSDAYTIADLARLSGINVRTIRYYLAQGLLPASGESGPGAHYGAGHLDRLRLTRRLQAQHLPLAEIRARLDQLADVQIAELVAEAHVAPSEPTTSALDYIRGLLAPKGSVVMPSPAPPKPSQPAPGRPPALAVGPPRYAEAVRATLSEEASVFTAASPAPADVPVEPAAHLRVAAAPITGDPPSGAQAPERSQWERLALGPNIELHVRRPLSRIEQRRVERLITIARQVLHKDES